jgi:hypothetical protein
MEIMSKRPQPILSFTAALVASALALVLVAPGCSSETGGDDTCHDYSAFNGTAPTVGFQADVLPIFRNSCGLSAACHGAEAAPAGQPYLGPPTSMGAITMAQLDAIFAQNVGATSTKATGMKIVEANSPQKSFLMHKMDNTLMCADVACEAGCGSSMPLANPVLSEADRDTVRRWIAQGAKND